MTMKRYINLYLCFLLIFTAPLSGAAQTDTISASDSTAFEDIQIPYGELNEALVASSISTVKGDELSKGASMNLGNTLYGKLPGLFVIQGSGEPGFSSPWLRIRGSDADPLFIVDGYERDISYLAPEEIESVSLLKDAAATAIYGMKGANGVVLITTKRGKIQDNQIDFTIQSGLQTPVNTMEVLDARQYMDLYNKAASNDGLPAMYTQQDMQAIGSSPRYPDVDWKDLALKDFTNLSRANVAARGGSEFIRYFVDLGAFYNNGIYEPSNPEMKSNANMRRINLRSNLDIQVTNSTVFSMNLSGGLEDRMFPANNASRIWTAMYTVPPNAFDVENPDGNYGGTSLLSDNPVAMLETAGNNHAIDRFLNAGFRLEQDFSFWVDGLSASLGYFLDNAATNADGTWRYYRRSQIAPGEGDDYEYYVYGENTEYQSWSNANSNRYTGFDASLAYELPDAGNHNLSALVRFQADEQWRDNNDLTPYLTRNLGGRIHYNYDQTYLLEFSASYFGSEQYASDNRYGFFPAVAAGWVFSNESFMKDNPVVSYGKFRASYGQRGLNPYRNGRYPYYQFYVGGGSFPLGTDWTTFWGTQPGMLANPDIHWETSTMLDVGIELGLWDQFSFAADFFMDKRSDVLYINYNHPSATGANLPYENIGEITNTGFDLEMGYRNHQGPIQWFTNLNFSFYDNTIDEMGETENPGNLDHLHRTGNPVSALYGYEVDGTFSSQQDGAPVQTFGPTREGDLMYKDQNGDGLIDSRDMTVVGNSSANIDVGLWAGIQYKGFDLEAMFQGQFNRDVMLNNDLYQPFIHNNSATEFVLEDDFPRLTLSNMNNYQPSSHWVRSMDFVKLRSIELGYSLPQQMAGKLSLDQFRVFARGINLFTLSDWEYTDPEFTWIGYAPMKAYYLGIDIAF